MPQQLKAILAGCQLCFFSLSVSVSGNDPLKAALLLFLPPWVAFELLLSQGEWNGFTFPTSFSTLLALEPVVKLISNTLRCSCFDVQSRNNMTRGNDGIPKTNYRHIGPTIALPL